jgi:hypothetical protein
MKPDFLQVICRIIECNKLRYNTKVLKVYSRIKWIKLLNEQLKLKHLLTTQDFEAFRVKRQNCWFVVTNSSKESLVTICRP